MNCSLQVKFSEQYPEDRQQNAAASFGTCIHHALELYNRGASCEDAVNEFLRVWDDPTVLDVTPTSWPKYSSFGAYRMLGVEIIQNVHEKLLWEHREVVACEHNFTVPFGEFYLTGTVDLIEKRQNASGKTVLRIVDYKTNKKQPTLISLQNNIQFSTYIYASLQPEFWDSLGGLPSFEFYQNVPRRGIWYHLNNSKEIDVGPRDQKDFERLYLACSNIKRAIDNDVFIPSINGDSCNFCSYKEQCGIRIPDLEEMENDLERWI